MIDKSIITANNRVLHKIILFVIEKHIYHEQNNNDRTEEFAIIMKLKFIYIQIMRASYLSHE